MVRVAMALVAATMAYGHVYAQPLPAGGDPATGARPGNEIGTGASWPRSDKASNIAPGDARSTIAPNLPSPPIDENAPVRDYLLSARSALFAGRTGEAQQALEMAATRALDRSVPLFQTNTAITDPLVVDIRNALQALGAGDRGRCAQIIESALQRAP